MYRYKTLDNLRYSLDALIFDCQLTDNVSFFIHILLKVCRLFLDICQFYFEEKGL